MNHLLVFQAPMSKARAKRIDKAVRAIDPDAYVMPGWLKPNYQPAVLCTPENHTPATANRLREIASATK